MKEGRKQVEAKGTTEEGSFLLERGSFRVKEGCFRVLSCGKRALVGRSEPFGARGGNIVD